MLAMSGSLMAGNDLADNLDYKPAWKDGMPDSPDSTGEAREHKDGGVFSSAVALRHVVLANSNLARISYFYLAPWLRTTISPEADTERINQALQITGRELNRFVSLAERYNFQPRLYILHPMQDLMRGTAAETVAAIRSISPKNLEVIPTHDSIPQPQQNYYYAYDGHLNAAGADIIARFLSSSSRVD